MAVIETWLRQDLKGLVTVRSLQGQVFSLDNGGNLIGVKVTKDGQPVTLTGTVTGYCILSDGQTVNITGSGNAGIQNGNEAYIVLPQLAYSVPGQISIVIKLTSGNTTTTLAACTGYVYKSRTSNEVVPPGTPIPDLATMEEVIRRATEATDAANAATVGAEKVDASMTKEGDVITIAVTDRDGNVTTETMTDTASDVSKLKSSFEQLNDNVITESAGPSPIVSIADGADGMPMRKVEVSIEPVQDLHGYDAPWPAGGGVCVLRQFEEAPSVEGLTITVDNGKITIDGTVANTITIHAPITNWQWDGTSDYWLSGCPAGGNSESGYSLRVDGEFTSAFSKYDIGNGVKLEKIRASAPDLSGMNLHFAIVLRAGTYTNLTFAPMLNAGLSAQPYSPYSNICPITGHSSVTVTRSGVNLWNEQWELGNISGTSGENSNATNRIRSIGYISVMPSTTYYFCTPTTLGLRYYDINKNLISGSTVRNDTKTMPDNCFYLRFIGVDTTTYDHDISINYPSTDHDYHPGRAQTYEVTFPAEPGTVYGGTLDVASGKLVVDRVYRTFNGSESWAGEQLSNPLRTYYFITLGALGYVVDENIVCDKYKQVSITSQNEAIGINILNSSARARAILNLRPNHNGMSVDEFKAWLAENPITCAYKITSTTVYQLTPTEIKTLLGTNNIWADAGNTAITYPVDTKTYIDNRINSTRKLIAGIETGFVASKAYAVGDMLIIGDDLYKVASSIASRATITVGTNVTKTTVAEQLIALANA